ncbi:MAG: hypothetical protein FJ147_28260 [Deltaproteobacteria bacterium]|nr:hypothetical protein [Deltaproteobacteria bacterium]
MVQTHTPPAREDLYCRLNVASMVLPPLRDRREDVPTLVRCFIEHSCLAVNRPLMDIEPAALQCLQAYHWPGNVRELQNAIERAMVFAAGSVIAVGDLPADIRRPTEPPVVVRSLLPGLEDELPLAEATDVFLRAKVRRVLDVTGGSQTEAARRLGLPQSNLSRLMKRLRLR